MVKRIRAIEMRRWDLRTKKQFNSNSIHFTHPNLFPSLLKDKNKIQNLTSFIQWIVVLYKQSKIKNQLLIFKM